MKKYFLYILLFSLVSCRKYVEVEQKGVKTLKSTNDYRYVMNDNSILETGYGLHILSGDDISITDSIRVNSLSLAYNNYQLGAYIWDSVYYTVTQSDAEWNRDYKLIYTCNEILEGVIDSEGGADSLKKQIYGEALVHRADTYFQLVNLFGKQYDEATAASDMGVPVLLTSNLYADLTRRSVKEVYSQITNDLTAALPLLPALPDFNVRPAKVSVYALLARVYLNKRDFVNAGLYADSALKLQSTLVNYSTLASNAALPLRLADPEIMLSKLANNSYTALSLNNNLVQLLGTSDLRYKFFTNTSAVFSGSFSAAFTGRTYWRSILGERVNLIGPGVPEMMLIKAEAAARQSDAGTAMSLVNTLRQNRFAPADYVALSATDASDALLKVVQERQRELFGRGFRWFDQRRLNKDAAFAATVTRTVRGVTYTLAPNSNRYLFPIPPNAMLLNPEVKQNPR
ncbi:SusD family protein [Filimonas lacunae]|uniref:SusD family protein n=1 Tax=Filimonas lacunae TaxID=477680 RepID=A0A173MAY6_9BACT|nr:RagB/SusD family nutrient uptake outer membrane protein [Filimonas lacunae]BAV04692.1 hypothetical protein FLA_0691 [Filimonas lacunae]SIT32368.1 SusD family protein [Filimonas lacunae]